MLPYHGRSESQRQFKCKGISTNTAKTENSKDNLVKTGSLVKEGRKTALNYN
jgi:hypothetical protein